MVMEKKKCILNLGSCYFSTGFHISRDYHLCIMFGHFKEGYFRVGIQLYVSDEKGIIPDSVVMRNFDTECIDDSIFLILVLLKEYLVYPKDYKPFLRRVRNYKKRISNV